MIPYGELLPILYNYCLSLGFQKPIGIISESSTDHNAGYDDNPAPFIARSNGKDTVRILSARVPYEPSWGVFRGLMRPLIHETADRRTDGTISEFIAPYLAAYQFTQNHIYLTCNQAGQYLVTIPSGLVKAGAKSDVKTLKIHLERIVDFDREGHFSPINVSDSFITYQLSENFLQFLGDGGFSWRTGKCQRIGHLLTSELFSFAETKKIHDSVGEKSTVDGALLPAMNIIVTDSNPQLLAAMIYLQNEFTRAINDVLPASNGSASENLLCIAGLDRDLAAFRGKGERYFVPWAACLQRSGRLNDTEGPLEQDDLFVALMAQKKQ
ncbi:MAG: hypothetical protein WBB19_01600 [Desulforhopalus sp.]